MPIVGTAGHVDHGKSTLVEALTGTDPDRWTEEKERGLTIDLGFAWTQIQGHDVGFVDVPGHERFIKNMLAGVGVVDCALLVVAADSGWMPQTEEHAAVLDLLDVQHGVIALSRTDLVDADTVELATLEVLEEIADTTLENWAVVPVSATTGAGLDDLRSEIAKCLDFVAATDDGRARMWVDRSFHIAGAGTVATGTVMSGAIHEGDELWLLPQSSKVKVRGLQHHGGPIESVRRGDRTAISFTGSAVTVDRGDLLVVENAATTTKRMLVMLRPTRSIGEIPDRGAFHLHIGTAHRPTQLRRIANSAVFIASFDEPVPAVVGDRVIVRDSGRKAVVGGGRVLDPIPGDRPDLADLSGLIASLDAGPDARSTALLEVHGSLPSTRIAQATSGGTPTNGVVAGQLMLSLGRASALTAEAATIVAAYQDENPVRPGIPKSELASRLRIQPAIIDALVRREKQLDESDGAVHAATFVNVLGAQGEQAWAVVKAELESGFDVPRMSSLSLDEEILHFMLRRGDLVRIGDDLVFTQLQIEQITERVAELDDGFTVSDFKDHFQMSRRQAVPTVEWLDSIGRTRRSGDGRTVR